MDLSLRVFCCLYLGEIGGIWKFANCPRVALTLHFCGREGALVQLATNWVMGRAGVLDLYDCFNGIEPLNSKFHCKVDFSNGAITRQPLIN